MYEQQPKCFVLLLELVSLQLQLLKFTPFAPHLHSKDTQILQISHANPGI